MDPFSVSTACVGLLAAVAQLSVQITQFVSGVREARRDMDSVSRELSSLALCLETLRDDSTKIQYPDGLRKTLVAVLKNCDAVTQQMHRLLEKMSSNSLGRRAQWVATGRDEMGGLRSSLEAYKSALDIALEMTAISILSAVKDDVKDVKADTTAIKEDTIQISNIKQDTSSLIQEIQFLRLQVTELQHQDTGGGVILQRFLQESTTYAETVIDSLDEREDSLRSQTPRLSLEESAVEVIRSEDSAPFNHVAERGQALSYALQEEVLSDDLSNHENIMKNTTAQRHPDLAEELRKESLATRDELEELTSKIRDAADSSTQELSGIEMNPIDSASPKMSYLAQEFDWFPANVSRSTSDLQYIPTGRPPRVLQPQSDLNTNYLQERVEPNAHGQLSLDPGHGPPLPPKLPYKLYSQAAHPNSQSSDVEPQAAYLRASYSSQGRQTQSMSRQPSSQTQIQLKRYKTPPPELTRKLPDTKAMEAAAAARRGLSARERKKLDDHLGLLIRGKKSLKDRVTNQRGWIGEIVGGVEKIRSVLDAGGRISFAEKSIDIWDLSQTLVSELCLHKRLDVIKLLLSYGALNQDSSVLAFRARIWSLPITVVRCLLEYWDNPNKFDGDRGTALFNTVLYGGSVTHVSLLLKYGADPNLDIGAHRYGHNHGSPLNVACFDARVDIVKVLLENGAEVNKDAGWPRYTPIQILAKGANEAAKELHHSAFARFEEVKELLKSYGADDVEFEEFRKLQETAHDAETMTAIRIGQRHRT